MSTFTKVGEWHDLGYGHSFVMVESSYAEKICGGILMHNVLGTDQQCEPGLVAWEQPGGPVRPLFRVVSPQGGQLSIEPFIVCEVCGDKGWIRNGKWVPKDDVPEDTEAQDPIPSVPVEGEGEIFTTQIRRDLGDVVPEEEIDVDRKLYDLSGGPDIRLDPEPVSIETPADWEKIDSLLQEGKESELLSVDESARRLDGVRDEYFVDKDKAKISEIVSPDAEVTTNKYGGSQSKIPVRFDLFDGPAMFEMAAVLHHGAEKYGANNWRAIPVEDHLNHALMHIFAYLSGDTTDDHLSHIMCRAMFAQGVECQDGIQDRKDV